MKTTVTELDDDRVKLSIHVDAADFEVEMTKAFKKIAKDVRMPGFRKGKVPRQVLEARFGAGVARGQALEDSIPQYFMDALSEHEVDIISPPEYEITAGEEDGDLEFDAVVQTRPAVEISGYDSIRVEVPNLEPATGDIDERVESFLGQFGELETADRPAVDKDTVTIDIETVYEGEQVEGLTTTDYDYRVGSGGVVAELDDNLVGASAGDELEFTATHPAEDEDGELEFKVAVQKVQAVVLPELTDDLVKDATDFESAEDFRADLVEKLRDERLQAAQSAWHDASAAQLGELVELDPPEPLVETEVRNRVEDMAQRLAQSGIGLDQYLQLTGQDAQAMIEAFRDPAISAVRVDMALRALAVAEGLEATEDDVDSEFGSISESTGIDVDKLREQISTPNQLMLFRADITKRKAADWLLESVEVVDEDGNPIDKDALHADHDQDHSADGDSAEDGDHHPDEEE